MMINEQIPSSIIDVYNKNRQADIKNSFLLVYYQFIISYIAIYKTLLKIAIVRGFPKMIDSLVLDSFDVIEAHPLLIIGSEQCKHKVRWFS